MKTTKNFIVCMSTLAVVILAFIFVPMVWPESVSAVGTVFALLPPVIAIVLALITKEVYSSLFIGILTGALMYSRFDFLTTVDVTVEAFVGNIGDSYNMGILIFLVILGIMVVLMNKAGGSKAYGEWAVKRIKSRKGAILSTVGLGCLIFVDDYFNCLTVGSIMRPVTDKFKVSRSKLSYIIDATAAPICIIAPISSWAAAVTGYITNPDINGFSVFLQSIPFNFYAILTIVTMIVMTVINFDFGPMKRHEKNAQEKGDLFTEGDHPYEDKNETAPSSKGKVVDLIAPVAVLIVSCILGMLYSGGILDGVPFIDAFAHCDASVGLVIGSLFGLIFTVIFYLARGILNFKEITDCIPQGFKAMVPAILILCFAWTLCDISRTYLEASTFVEGFIGDPQLGYFLPALLFVLALGIAFATGTSWGTFGLLLGIIVPTAGALPQHLLIAVSAAMAGAVCGDHISPISDTTIMASAGAQCNHLNHVKTQIPYAILVAGVSFVCYIISGFLPYWYVMFPLSIALMIGTIFGLKFILDKKKVPVVDGTVESTQETAKESVNTEE